MVYLSYGTTINPDGYAINDFETLSDGSITNLNNGVSVNGGLLWLETTLYQR